MPSMAQWQKLNEFLLQVGAEDDQTRFCVNTLMRLKNVVSFDQGRVYFMDEDSHVYDEFLIGVSKKTTKAYHEYYEGISDARYSATKRAKAEANLIIQGDAEDSLAPGMRISLVPIHVMNWADEPHDTRFYREHVAPQGLTYCTGFQLYDDQRRPRALFCIDRTRPVEYSRDEVQLLSLAATHLGNMFRKMFASPPVVSGDTISLMAGGAPLTERERQIATMLMRGYTPKAIAELHGISRTTVYKHVQNIHAKLGVSNQVELVAKLQESAARGKDKRSSTES